MEATPSSQWSSGWPSSWAASATQQSSMWGSQSSAWPSSSASWASPSGSWAPGCKLIISRVYQCQFANLST